MAFKELNAVLHVSKRYLEYGLGLHWTQKSSDFNRISFKVYDPGFLVRHNAPLEEGQFLD